MTTHAAQLLEDHLEASDAALPSADALLDAFESTVVRQVDVYDRILLPRLGLGERLEMHGHRVATPSGEVHLRGGEVWIFDARPDQSWLHAPFLIPFADFDDTLTLVHRTAIEEAIVRQIRPPMPPGVRQALAMLDWVPVDSGGFDGGRLEQHEFLAELGDRRWHRIDHDATTAAARLECWHADDSLWAWTTNVYDAFACSWPDARAGFGARVEGPWAPRADQHPFETAVAVDLLDDPYAILRRLVWQDIRLDIDRLGPLWVWKDTPDAMVEFNDREDGSLTDIPHWLSVELQVPVDALREVLDRWFDDLLDACPVELPGIGTLSATDVPPVRVHRPPALFGTPPSGEALLPAQTVFAASQRPPRDWLD